MKKFSMAMLGALVLGSGLAAQNTPAKPQALRPKPAMAVTHNSATLSLESQSTLVKQYCAGCHSEKGRSGGLSLANFDPAGIDQNAEVVEKMIRKLRAGMMPPPGARRPDGDALTQFVTALETGIDTAVAAHPRDSTKAGPTVITPPRRRGGGAASA